MGYYSTVLVKCDDTAYTRIKEVFDKYKNEYPTQINKDVENDLWVLYWGNVNYWEDYYQEVYDEITNIVHENKGRLKMAVIGEDSSGFREMATDYGIDLGIKIVLGNVSDESECECLFSI